MSLSFNSEIFTGIITNTCISGSVSGSFTGSINGFSGSLNDFSGILSGFASGSYSISASRFLEENQRTLQRSLIQFDLSDIYTALVNGDIVNPIFTLNLKTTDATALPLKYKIYAYPLSSAWQQGSGVYAFGGEDVGVNWVYSNYPDTSSAWYSNIDISYIPTDNYLDYPSTESFLMGGGVWYYTIPNNFTQPTSSIQTTFFNLTASNFEQIYSSSLQTNLTASFDNILSASFASVLNDFYNENIELQNAYNDLETVAITIYNNVTSNISVVLSDAEQFEVDASVCFLASLSASLQSGLAFLQQSSSYASSSYAYVLQLVSNLSSSCEIYSNVYAELNLINNQNITSSINALNDYNTYINFYTDVINGINTGSQACFLLTSNISPCVTGSVEGVAGIYGIYYDNTDFTEATNPAAAALYANFLYTSSLLGPLQSGEIGFVYDSITPYVMSSSLEILQSQFNFNIFNVFSSSFINYFDEEIQVIADYTYQEALTASQPYYASQYFSSLWTGSSLICSQSFDYYQKSDITMDITEICKAWMAGAVENNGLILLSSDEISTGDTNGFLHFFSKETNTIYYPYIDIQWDDSTFSTGNLSPITSSVGTSVSIKNLKTQYTFGSIVRFDVYARDLYPRRSFQRLQTVYIEPKYLPSSSYYAIKDMESSENIVNFDECTKVSCDLNGNFFMFDTTSLPQERYYKILIKVITDESTDIYDSNAIFKIVR